MSESERHLDALIIGGGPAGLSAALWCADLGMRAAVVEKETEFGGQLLWTFNAIDNYLGLAACNGVELRDKFLNHLEPTLADRRLQTEVVSLDLNNRLAVFADGRELTAGAFIIATGVRRRKLLISGETEFLGRGLLRSGVKEKNQVAGKRVVVVGGGDAALENALILAETAEHVMIVHRKSDFTARPDFVDRAACMSHVESRPNHRLVSIGGGGKVESVEIEDAITSERVRVDADFVLIRIGVTPNTELFKGQVELNEMGYIVVDASACTNVDNVFAAGDCTSNLVQTVATAAGMGSAAAKSAFRYLNPIDSGHI